MVRVIDTLCLKPALFAAFALAAFGTGAGSPEATRAIGAPGPRVTLSIPTEVTSAVPAVAKGRIVPAQRGRVLLQVWSARAWRALAAGKVHRGGFRIAFVPQQAAPTELRIRATLVRGGRSMASSPARKVQIKPATVAPGPAPTAPIPPKTTSTAPGPAVASGEPPRGEEPPAGEEPPKGEEPPNEEPPGEEEPPVPPPPPGNAYWGAWIGSQFTGKAPPWDMGAVSAFEQLVDKSLSLLEFSSPFADCTKSPCTYFNFPWDPFNAIRAHGAIPFFSWASQAIPGSPNQADFQDADIIAGTYDNYIRAWATRAAEWGHPFFLRYDWEMNGDWFSWGEGTNGNQPGEFATAWRHVHDIFTEVGATNATWVWCPYINHLNLLAGLYPGDAYVDWTCLDGYNWGDNPAAPYGWKTFDTLYGPAYKKVAETLAPSKPMVIGEIAATEYGGSKALWIEEMFDALETRYPKIRGLVWFETVGNGMDWPLESSQSAVDAFAAGISDPSFLGNLFSGTGSGPVPVP